MEVPQLQFIDSVRASSLNRDRHPRYFARAMPGSTVDTCSLSASGCFWPFCPHFLRERNSGPEVDSRPARLAVWRSVHS